MRESGGRKGRGSGVAGEGSGATGSDVNKDLTFKAKDQDKD